MFDLGFDVAHLLDAAILVVSFALLFQRRMAGVINGFALHALLLSAAAAWQGIVQDAPHLYVTALIALLFKAIFIPLALHRIVVRLEIHPPRSSGIVDPTTGLPTEQTSEVTTNIMIRDGETVAIGGLIETRDVNTTSRVPILGYLPGIGWLFSTEETEIERNEIVVLLTPHILEDGATYGNTDDIVADSKADTRQMRQNAGPVARIEQAFRTLEDARAALERGDLDEARLLCDRSLLLDPLADGALELSREIDARLEEDAHDGG